MSRFVNSGPQSVAIVLPWLNYAGSRMPLHNSKSNSELRSNSPGSYMKTPKSSSSRPRRKNAQSENSLSYSTTDTKQLLGEARDMFHSQYLSPLSYSAQSQRYCAQHFDYQEAESPPEGCRGVLAESDLQHCKSTPLTQRTSSTGAEHVSKSSILMARSHAHRVQNHGELSSDELNSSGRQAEVDNKQGVVPGLQSQDYEQFQNPWPLSIYSWLRTIPESVDEFEPGLPDIDSSHHSRRMPSVDASLESPSRSRLSSSTEVGMSLEPTRATHTAFQDSTFSVNSMTSSESTALVPTMKSPGARATQSTGQALALDPRLIFGDSLSWEQLAPMIETTFSWSFGQEAAIQGEDFVADGLADQSTQDGGIEHWEMESFTETDFMLSPNVTPYRKGKDPTRKRRPSYYDDDILGARIAA